MASFGSRVGAAWRSLWSDSNQLLAKSASPGPRRWQKRLHPLTFKATGPVVLLNHDPWGAVDVNLYDNQLSQLDTISGDDFTYDDATGQFTGTIRFADLKYSGKYTLQRGRSSGSAMKAAFTSMRPEASGAPGDDSNIAAAKAYQKNLTSSANGRTMLSTYYQYNDEYAACYQNTKYLKYWQTYKTNGQTTQVYAAQTANAANNPSGPAVNGDPGYNPHAFFMNTLVVATCNAQGNQDAATAASCFKQATSTPSGSSQTVNQVMNIVATTPPPSPSQCNPSSSKMLMATIHTDLLPGMHDDLQTAIAEIQQEEDDVRAGIILRENTGRPISGEFRAHFGTQPLTVEGTVTQTPNGPQVELTKLTGPAPEVRVHLGAFPGNLHAEVENALDRANFLKGVLGQRILGALNQPSFLNYLGAVLSVAIKNNAAA